MSEAVKTTMVRLTLPDGSAREYPAGVTGQEVAASIGAGLARAAVAIRVGNEVRDLMFPIREDAPIAILTEKDPAALPVLRHSAAHILATAVREIFPTAGIGFGPAIDEGFSMTLRKAPPNRVNASSGGSDINCSVWPSNCKNGIRCSITCRSRSPLSLK